MNYRLLITIICTILLSACSTTPSGPIIPPPESVSAISKWETAGRVGIRTKDDAVSGNFDWQKSPEAFSLNIVGPFGQGATKLSSNNDGQVTLAYGDKVIKGNNAGDLLQQELGWEFPVEQLTYWIRGLASPFTPATIIQEKGSDKPDEIQQDSWKVSYKSYTKVDGLYLPRKMQISRPPFRVNLIINQWTIQ